MEVRGVQKTDEPKKPFQTDLTDAKILARFRFGSVLVLLFGFRLQILIHRTEPKYIK